MISFNEFGGCENYRSEGCGDRYEKPAPGPDGGCGCDDGYVEEQPTATRIISNSITAVVISARVVTLYQWLYLVTAGKVSIMLP